MIVPYTPPKFSESAFNCPHCNAFANQKWGDLHYDSNLGPTTIINFRFAFCTNCQEFSLWKYRNQTSFMVYPIGAFTELPNKDLPLDIIEDYNEARSIVQLSPKGASALLRLCIQKLCVFLGEKGKNINDDIANLVKSGLPPMIQQALDSVRVIGNQAVHPGQIDFNDNPNIATQLFSLVNLIANTLITQPKQVAAIFDSLPEGQKQAIEKRDKNN
jgi:hypothetical protein